MSIGKQNVIDWAKSVSFAVTICDCKGFVIYANDKSQSIFAKHGPLIGRNLKDCHPEKAWIMINELMRDNKSNSYTIEKNGIKKIIHQTPWYEADEENKKLGGLVEISIEIPFEMNNFIRE